MGDKYTLKKTVTNRRKKRGKYRVKPKKKKDPRDPSTQEEKDKIFPGYEETNRLAKGIVEDGAAMDGHPEDDDDEGIDDEVEKCLADTIPDKWGAMMSDVSSTQKAFKDRLNESRASFKKNKILNTVDDMAAAMESAESKAYEDIQARLQKIQDNHPSFLKDLTYLVAPLADLDAGNAYEPSELGERKRPLTGQTRDEIKKTCQRYGLGKSWNDLLIMLNQLNAAGAGKLFTPQKK